MIKSLFVYILCLFAVYEQHRNKFVLWLLLLSRLVHLIPAWAGDFNTKRIDLGSLDWSILECYQGV
jgi:hypothetical protein